jgi:hypothetical protein
MNWSKIEDAAMGLTLVCCFLAFVATGHCQTKDNKGVAPLTTASPKLDRVVVAPLTDEEKISILTAQKTLFQKYSAYQQKMTELKAAEAEVGPASDAVVKAWVGVEETRHLKPGEAVRCDGPAPLPDCQGVAPGEVALKVKPEAKK